MKVTGYWPLEGSSGIGFLKKLMAGSERAGEKHIKAALQQCVLDAEEVASGLGSAEIEPENLAVLAESEGGVEEAMLILGIWKEAGRFWMRKETFDSSNRAFVACAVLFRAAGGVVAGEIYNECEQAIDDCAKKLSREQVASLRLLGRRAVAALVHLGDLTWSKPIADVQLMDGELHKFASCFDGSAS